MIKNIFLTMIMDKKAMKEVNSYRNSFFIIYIVIALVIQVLANFFLIRMLDDYTLFKIIALSFLKPFLTVIFNCSFGYILYLAFYFKEKIKIPDFIFKAIVSMDFIMPITCLVTIFLDNIFLTILIIIYDLYFTINYMKTNIELDLSEKNLKGYVIVSFILTFILLGFIIGFGMFVSNIIV